MFKKTYLAITGCAVCSGIAVGVIEDARHWVEDRIAPVLYSEPSQLDLCWSRHFDDVPRPEAGVYHIVVTQPQGDADRSQYHLIERSLRRQFGDALDQSIQVEAIDCPPLRPSGGVAGQMAQIARDRAAELAKTARADAVIWGEVLRANEKLHLRFLTADETTKADYSVGDITLDTDFSEDIGGLIAAKALAVTEWTPEEAGSYIADRMQFALGITRPLVNEMPRGLDADAKGAIWTAHGNASLWIGLQSGSNTMMHEAVAAYQSAIGEWTRDRVPLGWAMTQYNMSIVRVRIFEKTGDAGALAQAQGHLDAARAVIVPAGASAYVADADQMQAYIDRLRPKPD